MRAIIPILLLMAILACCSYIQKEAIPMHLYTAGDIQKEKLTVGETVTETRYGFRLFTIPISVPEPVEMAEDLVRKNQARGLTDLDVEFSEFLGPSATAGPEMWAQVISLIFQIPKIEVTGRVVR